MLGCCVCRCGDGVSRRCRVLWVCVVCVLCLFGGACVLLWFVRGFVVCVVLVIFGCGETLVLLHVLCCFCSGCCCVCSVVCCSTCVVCVLWFILVTVVPGVSRRFLLLLFFGVVGSCVFWWFGFFMILVVF